MKDKTLLLTFGILLIVCGLFVFFFSSYNGELYIREGVIGSVIWGIWILICVYSKDDFLGTKDDKTDLTFKEGLIFGFWIVWIIVVVTLLNQISLK